MAEVRTDFIPLLPLNNGVVLPNMVVTIPLEREEAQAAVAAARQGDGLVLLVPRVEGRFANFGTVAKLEDSRKLPNGIEVAILQGLYRASVGSAAAGTGTALRVLAQPVRERLPVGLQIENGIQRAVQFGEHRVQRLPLWQGAGKPVQDEAGFGVGLGEALPDDVDHQLVRDQLAAIEVGADALS